MKVLIACEESQEVCKAFRKLGHEAYSCDIMKCSGGHPEWHINYSCLQIINGGCEFMTQDGEHHEIDGTWDLIIAHPPCTYLTVSGNAWFNTDKYNTKAKSRYMDRVDGIKFFMEFVVCNAKRVAIENPIGVMSNVYRKPDQIIHPWMFGDNVPKETCLWLKGLDKLVPEVTEEPEMEYFEWISKDGKKKRQAKWYMDALGSENRQQIRSKTFEGIARAMAEQWGKEA